MTPDDTLSYPSPGESAGFDREVARLADLLRRIDYMNWTAAEVAERLTAAGVRVAPTDKDPMEGVACDWDEDGNCRCVRVAPSPDAPATDWRVLLAGIRVELLARSRHPDVINRVVNDCEAALTNALRRGEAHRVAPSPDAPAGAARCICSHPWSDHMTWCYSSGCPCRFTPAPSPDAPGLRDAAQAVVDDWEAIDEDEEYLSPDFVAKMAALAAALRAALALAPKEADHE